MFRKSVKSDKNRQVRYCFMVSRDVSMKVSCLLHHKILAIELTCKVPCKGLAQSFSQLIYSILISLASQFRLSNMETEYSASFLCGKVGLNILGPVGMSVVCHCEICRRHTGCAYSHVVSFPPGRVTYLESNTTDPRSLLVNNPNLIFTFV